MSRYKTWGVLLIPAGIKTAAGQYLADNDIGGGEANFAHPLIAEGADDEAEPIGYAAILKCTDQMVDVLRKGANLNANAYAFFAQRRTTAQMKALHFIRTRGYRIKPILWMAFCVKADLSQSALAYLATHDITPTITRALILEADPDETPARYYAAMITADHYAARVVQAKARTTPGAFLFASADKATSQADALAFIAAHGYRVKP